MIDIEEYLELLSRARSEREKDKIAWQILEKVVETLDHLTQIISDHLEEHKGDKCE